MQSFVFVGGQDADPEDMFSFVFRQTIRDDVLNFEDAFKAGQRSPSRCDDPQDAVTAKAGGNPGDSESFAFGNDLANQFFDFGFGVHSVCSSIQR